MKIGLDLGGVIVDIAPVKLKLARDMFGVLTTADRLTEPTLDPRLSLENYRKLQNLAYGTSAFLESPAMPYALSTIRELQRAGHEIHIVSNIQVPGVRFAQQWLRDHELDSDMLVSVGVEGSKKLVLQHGFQLYVDASPEILPPLAQTIQHLFLLTTPANRNVPVGAPAVRVENWPELLRYITHINNFAHAGRG